MQKLAIVLLIALFFGFLACSESPYMQGKRLYAANCLNCHMEDGSGLGGIIPSLTESDLLGTTAMACVIKNGLDDTIFEESTYFVREMPAFKKFSPTEVANIVNYINHSWKKPFKESTILDINAALDNCK